jgi:hypothetical protein
MQAYVVILFVFGLFFLIEIVSILKLVVEYLPPIKRLKISLRINFVVFITAFLLIAVVVLFDVNYFRYKSPMPYSAWKSITFSEFRGLNRPGQTLDGQNEFAFIVPEIRLRHSGNSLEVITYFHPSRSYVFNNAIEDGKLLNHELYHLHIAEYCARLFRKKLTEYTKPLTSQQINISYAEILKTEDRLQFQYDDETYHSYLAGKQKRWEMHLDSCLESLKSFQSTNIINMQ